MKPKILARAITIACFLVLAAMFFAVFTARMVNADNSTLFTCTHASMPTFTISASGSTSSTATSLTASGSLLANPPSGYTAYISMYEWRCACPGVNQATCGACSGAIREGIGSAEASATTDIGDACATLQSDTTFGSVILENSEGTRIGGFSCRGNGGGNTISAIAGYVCPQSTPTPILTNTPTVVPPSNPTTPPILPTAPLTQPATITPTVVPSPALTFPPGFNYYCPM